MSLSPRVESFYEKGEQPKYVRMPLGEQDNSAVLVACCQYSGGSPLVHTTLMSKDEAEHAIPRNYKEVDVYGADVEQLLGHAESSGYLADKENLAKGKAYSETEHIDVVAHREVISAAEGEKPQTVLQMKKTEEDISVETKYQHLPDIENVKHPEFVLEVSSEEMTGIVVSRMVEKQKAKDEEAEIKNAEEKGVSEYYPHM